MEFEPLGDSALVITLGERMDASVAQAVERVARALTDARLAGVTDVVPAYTSVTLFYDPIAIPGEGAGSYERLRRALLPVVRSEVLAVAGTADSGKSAGESSLRHREIPVCYGGEYGPDLDLVANHAGLAVAEVIALHAKAEYRVQAIGFAPGFPYLTGLPPELQVPRRPSPRLAVPPGSVGIGGAQTGVYPLATPGGWQLIGRTSLKLFDAQRSEPAWLRVGDVVTFRAISPGEFAAWK